MEGDRRAQNLPVGLEERRSIEKTANGMRKPRSVVAGRDEWSVEAY